MNNKHPHLLFQPVHGSFDRRKRTFVPPKAPKRGGRNQFTKELEEGFAKVLEEAMEQELPKHISPHLVFHIPLAEGVSTEKISEKLKSLDITVVSIEPNKAIVAFKDDTDLSKFQSALKVYKKGPPQNRKSTKWDIFEYIEAKKIRRWSLKDRIGLRLINEIGEGGQNIKSNKLYFLDLELWHTGETESINTNINEIKKYFQPLSEREKIYDQFIGENICLFRVSALGKNLKNILNFDIIAEVDLPLKPKFDSLKAKNLTIDGVEHKAPEQNGPKLCVIDSGVNANHPLLRNNVQETRSFLNNNDDATDEVGHGTAVSSIAIYGDIRNCLEQKKFSSPILLYSARVLNRKNEFDDEQLIPNQIKEVIAFFKKEPYNCRVFNLSVGSNQPAFQKQKIRQTILAETIDILIRELEVILVISSGNNSSVFTQDTNEAERISNNLYKEVLLKDSAKLNDPATSSLAITVGSTAKHINPISSTSTGAQDITRPISNRVNEISAFSRVGPGLRQSIKPDFVDYGGNVAFQGYGQHRIISKNNGLSIMLFSHNFVQNKYLFSYDIGTSFSAPLVARKAAVAWHSLEQSLKMKIHPNLIKAILGLSAKIQETIKSDFMKNTAHKISHIYGYGQVDEDIARLSSDSSVTLCYQGKIEIDKFLIFELPIVDAFKEEQGKKILSVSLAYDPPVRRRRYDYLGVEMDFDIIRGKTINEIKNAYSKVKFEEEVQIEDKFKIKSDEAGKKLQKNSTLQCRKKTMTSIDKCYGETYHLVVRCIKKWTPSDVRHQNFAVAVNLKSKSNNLYQSVKNRLSIRRKVRIRR